MAKINKKPILVQSPSSSDEISIKTLDNSNTNSNSNDNTIDAGILTQLLESLLEEQNLSHLLKG